MMISVQCSDGFQQGHVPVLVSVAAVEAVAPRCMARAGVETLLVTPGPGPGA